MSFTLINNIPTSTEDKHLPHSSLAVGRVNSRKFHYRRPDGEFIFSMFNVIYSGLRDTDIYLEKESFANNKVFTERNSSSKFIWVYLDVSASQAPQAVDGKMRLVLSGKSVESAPSFPSVSESDRTSISYSFPIRYITKHSKKHIYNILLEISDDSSDPTFIIVKPVTFECDYIDIGKKQLVRPKSWHALKPTGGFHSRPPKAIATKSKMNVSLVSEESKKRADRDDSDANDVEEVVEEQSPPDQRPLKKVQIDSSSSLADVDLILAREGPTFEERAMHYAWKYLINKPELQQQAVDKLCDMFEDSVVQDIEARAEVEVYNEIKAKTIKDINSDPSRKAKFWTDIRGVIKTEILASEGNQIREEIRESIRSEMEKKNKEKMAFEIIAAQRAMTSEKTIDPNMSILSAEAEKNVRDLIARRSASIESSK